MPLTPSYGRISTSIELNLLLNIETSSAYICYQDPDKEERYINNYRVLSDELSRSHELSCPSVGPFHYGSHYSNTGKESPKPGLVEFSND